MGEVPKAFEDYRNQYPSRAPDLTKQVHADETRLLTLTEGYGELTVAPAKAPTVGIPPSSPSVTGTNRYLWVVALESVPIAMEELRPGVHLDRGRLSHTNLTGGANAHCGGELWFINDSSIVLNGGSGRYPPRSSAELAKVANAFKAAGYRTASMGWNTETNASYRSLRGDPQWL
jgi:hypothetical protein